MDIFSILVPLVTIVMLLLASYVPYMMGCWVVRSMSKNTKKTIHVIRRY